MLPSSTLCRVASRAVTVFAVSAVTPTLSSSASDFPGLVDCTRSLVLLTKTGGKRAEDAHLLRCLQQCTDFTLDALCRLPPSADVPPDVAVILFGVLRSSVGFWPEEKAAQLAFQLSERVDAVVLQTWRPRVLLAAVHAVAKACPSQAHLPLLPDALALLHHHEAQLNERDVATLLWCLAVLQVAPTQPRMWASLCKRAALQFSRMNTVSRLTLTQALLLQQESLCESQAELLRIVHEANCEMERIQAFSTDELDGSSPRYGKQQQRGTRRGHRTAHFYANSNVRNNRSEAPSQLTAQLLQFTTHTLSDEALVRLFTSLVMSTTSATDELHLVGAYLTQRTSLSERLCVRVLRFVQQVGSPDSGGGRSANATSTTALGSYPKSASELVRRIRQHVTHLLIQQTTRTGLTHAPREVLEALCVEHYCLPENNSVSSSSNSRTQRDASTSSRSSKEAVTRVVVWDSICEVLENAFVGGSSSLQRLGGSDLWGWVCIQAYVQSIHDTTTSSSHVPDTKGKLQGLAHLNLYVDIQRCWPNPRERQEQCTELIIASAQGRATHLLTFAGAQYSSKAVQLLNACARETHACVPTLPIAATLRLLAAVDAAPAIVSPAVHTLQPQLLSKLESPAPHASGAMPEMIRYLSNVLAHERIGSGAARGDALASPRVSDAVLAVYVRLLVEEQQATLPAVQVDLLVRCLEERQHRPAALENAFMMVMTRRLGQPVALVSATTLPIEAMCRLIELAGGLPRAHDDAAATATRTLILTTFLDALMQRCIPACTSADGLVAAGMLLRLDLVEEFQRVAELAAALERRGTALLSGGGAAWTPTQKAYLIAALVCAQKEPSRDLLRALHGDDTYASAAQSHP